MIKPLGYENMNPVQLALFCARFQLAFLHGSQIALRTGEGDETVIHDVDNLEYIALIDNANAWLDKSDGKVFHS